MCHFSAKGRTNMELREKFILPEGTTQVMASFRYRGRRSRPSSRGASPNRSTSSQSCPVPFNPSVAMTAKVRGPTSQRSGRLSNCRFTDHSQHDSSHFSPLVNSFYIIWSLSCLLFVFLTFSNSCSFWFVNPCLCIFLFVLFDLPMFPRLPNT